MVVGGQIVVRPQFLEHLEYLWVLYQWQEWCHCCCRGSLLESHPLSCPHSRRLLPPYIYPAAPPLVEAFSWLIWLPCSRAQWPSSVFHIIVDSYILDVCVCLLVGETQYYHRYRCNRCTIQLSLHSPKVMGIVIVVCCLALPVVVVIVPVVRCAIQSPSWPEIVVDVHGVF